MFLINAKRVYIKIFFGFQVHDLFVFCAEFDHVILMLREIIQ